MYFWSKEKIPDIQGIVHIDKIWFINVKYELETWRYKENGGNRIYEKSEGKNNYEVQNGFILTKGKSF